MRRIAGWTFIILCLGAVVLSLGAPGLGWALTIILLYGGGFAAPRIGRIYLAASLAIALVNLFWVGPMAGFKLPLDWEAGPVVFFLVLPLLTTCLAIFSTN